MGVKSKFQNLVSLSTASFALLNSIASTKGKPLDVSILEVHKQLTNVSAQTGNLVLEPALQEEMLLMYAGHHSHSSHSSHSSHASHSSGVGHSSHYSGTSYTYPTTTPSAPATPRTPPPVTYPAYSTSKAQTTAATPLPVWTASTKTNKPGTNTTSEPVQAEAQVRPAIPAKNLEFLKKRAAEGSSDAQYSLAIAYLYDREGVKADTERAKMLLELSAAQGNSMAKTKLQELQGTAQPAKATATNELEKAEK